MSKQNKLIQIVEKAGLSSNIFLKFKDLLAGLSSIESAVIAYSGGVDSSFLSYLVSQLIPNKMIAITIISPLESPLSINLAKEFADKHMINSEIIPLNQLENPEFISNPENRCYICKLSILHRLHKYAAENGYQFVLEGQNADDQFEYRPGRKAVEETGTLSPLALHGFTKTDIRTISKIFHLSTWDQPSSPCMATRFPYGNKITTTGLEHVAAAESYLHEQGFKVVRVRYYQNKAVIEVATG